MMKKFRNVIMGLAVVSLLGFWGCKNTPRKDASIKTPPANTGSKKPCPWRITSLEVGKWANGKLKRSTIPRGDYPTQWVTERPDWYVNGTCVGKAVQYISSKQLRNSTKHLKAKAENTVTVKFSNPPYAGTSSTYEFYFDPDKIKPGESVEF